ncbi:MAG: fasciclin domain-containing protein [Gemmatimonadaceae bacterium]|nr:fasciclin domain-containing protein [Gemmatimonadaceae bacterium]
MRRSRSGPVPVLIPNDAAFRQAAQGAHSTRCSRTRARCGNMLPITSSRVASQPTTSRISQRQGTQTVEGERETRIGRPGTQLTIGTANVVRADVMAKNGIIHVIDTVLIPPGR